MLKQLLALAVGVFWAYIYSLKSLFDFIRLGPSEYFFVNRNAPAPKELTEPKYGEHHMINLGAVKLHYVISGPDDAPLMVLLHGFPEIWFSWRHQILEFQKDFRVVAVDMRGYGDSDKPKGLTNYKMTALVEDVKLLIEGLGYRSCVLMGHDWGGAVAWAFASKHPDMVDRLVAMNMCPAPLWWQGASSNLKQFLCSGYIFYFFLPLVPEFVMSKNDVNIFHLMFNQKFIGLRSGPMSYVDVGCYQYYYRQKGAFTPGINYYRANLWPPAIKHPLNFPMPVHIVWGMCDPYLTHKLLKDTLTAVPHASVTRLEDCSHWVQNDRPDKVNQAVRNFLKYSKFDGTAKRK